MTNFFQGPKSSWIWLVIRLYVGYQWMTAGWHKIIDGFDASGFLKGAIAKAVPASEGAKPVVQAWWANFLEGFALPNVGLFNFLVPWGEFLVGLALILGFATIFAATMGMVMNFAFILSGTISSNPNLLILEFVLVALGGAYAGYLGVDYYFRPVWRSFIARILPGEADAAAIKA
ncbi:thiosulfate dehydrogenase [quinone] large subunit [Symbiobacterium terraclitae]|uniref:Thiosulfate dehydrogenase [quinone] large subunit n=1 Tax=Symbiobacterium terraclitae TaxID=557451 RepID=A0ABS4JRU9_9FIRM|nr:DoxX family protein [Symbiobacterium terraclitae]MBP2018263.1 thiosulfate dehydrogenase [quinone] large subunit [Symbiobacterium terraclitae]